MDHCKPQGVDSEPRYPRPGASRPDSQWDSQPTGVCTVAAVRRGEFSTGTALECVTEWAAERKFAFVVEQDVPALRERSPYDHVHASHVRGYFLTNLYWMPLARLVVDLDNDRVLRHIKRRAEKQNGSDGL